MMYQSNTIKLYYVYYCTRETCFDSYRIIFRPFYDTDPYFTVRIWILEGLKMILQGESFARGPKLLSIKNYVFEIMTWKFIYTYWERCKTWPTHNRCWNWSLFTSKHTWMRFSKFWNTFPKVSMLTTWISWHRASLSFLIVLEAQ